MKDQSTVEAGSNSEIRIGTGTAQPTGDKFVALQIEHTDSNGETVVAPLIFTNGREEIEGFIGALTATMNEVHPVEASGQQTKTLDNIPDGQQAVGVVVGLHKETNSAFLAAANLDDFGQKINEVVLVFPDAERIDSLIAGLVALRADRFGNESAAKATVH